MGDIVQPKAPRVLAGKNIPVTPERMAFLESHAPKGWKFYRSAYTVTENHGEGLRIWFANRAPTPKERRPNIRLLTLAQLKALPLQLVQKYAELSGRDYEDVVIDCVLQEKEVREIFSLGHNVELLGVRTSKDGKGFSLRCVGR